MWIDAMDDDKDAMVKAKDQIVTPHKLVPTQHVTPPLTLFLTVKLELKLT